MCSYKMWTSCPPPPPPPPKKIGGGFSLDHNLLIKSYILGYVPIFIRRFEVPPNVFKFQKGSHVLSILHLRNNEKKYLDIARKLLAWIRDYNSLNSQLQCSRHSQEVGVFQLSCDFHCKFHKLYFLFSWN